MSGWNILTCVFYIIEYNNDIAKHCDIPTI